ncbi:hypothetical protein Purlil1_13669 [Purpureocillium lilacinum]|uniref:Protein kinase domain-containing protein n=1 Tax=Purpureocillium lilacinum TaxID=33203 RepID=A0ABR0BE51_PURLI|nr:hypothetical protein Purlil1_13669 [Purpureocillium lilacinum]
MSLSKNKLDEHTAAPDTTQNVRGTVIDFKKLIDRTQTATSEGAPSIYQPEGSPAREAVARKRAKHTPTLAGLPEAGERGLYAKDAPPSHRPDGLAAPSTGQQLERILPSLPGPEQKIHAKEHPTSFAPVNSASRNPTWESLFDLELGGDRRYLVAQSTGGTGLLLVQRIEDPEGKEKLPGTAETLAELQSIRHGNIVAPIHLVQHQQALLVAWEFMPMSLVEIARSRFLTEARVAAILDQVLKGLQHLHGEGFQHLGLSCSTVFVNAEGTVKIGGLEGCRKSTKSGPVDTKPLQRLTVELLSGSYNKEGTCRITNPRLQTINLCDFLSDLDKICTFSTLREHKLFDQKGGPESLLGIVAYANYFYHWIRKCPPVSRDYHAHIG